MTLRELLPQLSPLQPKEESKEITAAKTAKLIAANKIAAQKLLSSALTKLEQNSSTSKVSKRTLWI